jgi:glycosyltransferase involved in cell wall biosynthesis
VLFNTITPLIITLNEADNIERTLSKLTWANQIIVVDSGSTDETVEIINRFKQTRIVFREFDDFASQCNFGLSLIQTPWVLSLDADYELTDELISEISRVDPGVEIAGYRANFVYRIYGRPLRGTLYPSRAVLYQHKRARSRNEGHGHRIEIEGAVSSLNGKIFHDDRKPFARWLTSQQRYAKSEAEHLFATPPGAMGLADRIRNMAWPAPPMVFVYTLFAKGCIFDGWPGWIYVLQRTLAETMIALELLEHRSRPSAR